MGPPPSITLKKAAASVTSKKDVPPVCIPKSKSKIPVHMDLPKYGVRDMSHVRRRSSSRNLAKTNTRLFSIWSGWFGVGPKLEPPMPVYPPVNNGRGSGTGQQQQQQFPNTFTEGQCYPQGHYPHPMMYGWPGMMPYMPPGYPTQPGVMPPPMQPYGWGQPYMYPQPQPAAEVQQPPAQGQQQYAPERQEQVRRRAPRQTQKDQIRQNCHTSPNLSCMMGKVTGRHFIQNS